MRNYFILLFCLVYSGCNTEPLVTIRGEFRSMDSVLVTLNFEGRDLRVDTVLQGKFKMLVKLPSNRKFDLLFSAPKPDSVINGIIVVRSPSLQLFSDDEDINFTIRANSIQDLYKIGNYQIITSSKNQINYNKYLALLEIDKDRNQLMYSYLREKQDKALSIRNDSLYTLYSDSLRVQERLNGITHNTVTKNFITNNPNSYISMYLLSRRADLKNNLAFYQLSYNKADRKYKKSWYGLYFAKRAQRLEQLKQKYVKKLPINARDITGSDFDYQKYSSSRLIVMDLWATWCIPCMEDIPVALKLEKELKEKSVSYVFMSYDFNRDYWKSESNRLQLKNSYYLSEATRKYFNSELDVVTIPRYLILSNKGDILIADAPSVSSKEFMQLIDSML